MIRKPFITLLILVFIALATAPMVRAQSVNHSDVAKMYLVKHELKMKKNASTAVFDGKTISVDPYLLRNERTYVPIKLVRDLQIGSVQWDGKTQSADIQLKEEYLNRKIGFKVGKPYLYAPDGSFNSDIKIPAPFIHKGRVYLPVSAMPNLGINVGYEKGILKWQWSEKMIEILKPQIHTENPEVTFTLLYQKDLYTPQYLLSSGFGGWLGYTGKIVDKDLKIDNRIYHRIEFRATVKPGMNPIMLTAVSMGNKPFEVIWKPEGNVPVNIENDRYLQIDKPANGFLQIEKGKAFTLAGAIKENSPQFTGFSVHIGKYSNHNFELVKTEQIPMKNLQFSNEIKLDEPGYYYIQVRIEEDPKLNFHLRINTWADFIVEVK
ncbi:stalk domain-containing protein [Peribacillus loiseleuriae]|uniref:Copper amine oxidase-like N-terminal domain-containing protein n=1 Tax=Peribacillus loiseleuriae TaxID=1679170 RepID=A0A0K9GWK4_9BACI|nr:stalk domain-containing protein [Peribacillus loiseleuriae]KMY51003.1 hypothetical protein AC625_16910 [Peribacillus loiseleuriae]